MNTRKSGVLAHPTSFPSRYGIGDLGGGAYEFVDFLKKAKQALWQVLPLGQTSFGDSPYQSFSTFAGNPYLISPEELRRDGLLEDGDMAPLGGDPSIVDYGAAISHKMEILRGAHARFTARSADFADLSVEYKTFYAENKLTWLEDFALFVAIKNHFIKERQNAGQTKGYKDYKAACKGFLTPSQIDDNYYGAVYSSWGRGLQMRETADLREYKNKLAEETDFYAFAQFLFFRQWRRLRGYANDAGVEIIGDLPIFVAMDSADTWANPKLFALDEDGRPTEVAGVPPDYFSKDGQLWGNPLYNWTYHKRTKFEWWKKRIAAALRLVDVVRIDHFIGFESYWAVPYGAQTAKEGKRMAGPGKALFDAVAESIPNPPIIAEDLGVLTEEVIKLREDCGFPGMKVLQFAFDGDVRNAYLPHNLRDPRTVLYTGTHDNDTTLGWYRSAPEKCTDYFRRYMNVSGEDAAWDMIRLAFSTSADQVVVPVQDILSLPGEARMNTPGLPSGNWRFRFEEGALTDAAADRLRYLSELFGRNVEPEAEEETPPQDPPEKPEKPKKPAGKKAAAKKPKED
ncbi:MAG: 4-alpha-glucanotransferase [Clostridiales bacterium]|jgi:4-alpha-glucanotransferase|nr:4-alpha-glucanotransferase [Clostridiales bacterium]